MRVAFRVTIGMAMLAAVLTFAEQPAYAATSFRAQTFNMAMGNSDYAHYDETVAVVLYLANSERPYIVALQEICEDQYDDLIQLFDSYLVGLNARAFQAYDDDNEDCNNGAEGTAVFGKGLAGSTYIRQVTPDYGLNRYLVCRQTVQIGFTFHACSTHLQSSRWQAADQADYMFHQLWTAGTRPWLLGGDFNLNYPTKYYKDGDPNMPRPANGHIPVAEFFYTHWEMHLPFEPVTFNPNAEKIDFMFADRVAFDPGAYHNCTIIVESDHRYCSGAFER